jgi:hypothetical protein
MKKFITIFYLLIISLSLYGQKLPSVDIVGGVGFAELVHLGVKTQVSKQGQVGLYYGNGFYYLPDEHYRTYSLDYQYHFGKESKHISRKVFYGHSELIYWTRNNVYEHMKSLALSIGVGRDFNFSDKMGMCLDFSLITALHQERVIKDEHYEPFLDITLADAPLLPTLRLQIFYSL